MKKIVRKTAFLFSLLFIAQCIFAQSNKQHTLSLNFGPEIIFPEAEFRRTHNVGFGASIKGEYTFGKHGSVTLNTGYSALSGRAYFDGINSAPLTYQTIVAIPVKAGSRYYFGKFYLQGEAGVVFLSKHVNATSPLFSIGAGDKFKIGKNNLDISLRQEGWFNKSQNFNMVVLRFAYEILW